MEIGSRLKKAREAKKLSLEDVQNVTKIQARYLDAIEKGHFDIMPGNFYIRAFIKEYAEAVGQDPNQLIEEHADELPPPTDDISTQYTRIQRIRNSTGSSIKTPVLFSFFPTLIVSLLFIGIIFAVWLFIQSPSEGDSNEVGYNNSDNGVEEIVVDPDEEAVSEGESGNGEQDGNVPYGGEESNEEQQEEEMVLEVVDQGRQGNEETVTYTLTNAEEDITLVFNTESQHWLELTNEEGEQLYNDMFDQEDAPLEEDLTDQEMFEIRFSNPSELGIMVDGKLLELPEATDKSLIHRVSVEVNNSDREPE